MVKSVRLSELCEILATHHLPARLEGEDREVHSVNTLGDAQSGELSFLSNLKYRDALKTTQASAVLVGDGVTMPAHLSAIRCTDPYAAVTAAIITIHGHRLHPQWGAGERATIDPTATIGTNPNIAHDVTIGARSSIGNDCTIYPGCYIADEVRMGDGCILFPNVVLYDKSVLGHRVTLHAGTVVGQDGLGYAPRGEDWVKIPQVGRAVIGDDVELGANCAIDRATLGQTEIGNGTKFGNGVIIGHGTKVGPHCLFVGQVGVAGSVTVGRHVTLAGQVGVAGHLSIGDNARAGGQAGIGGDVEAGADVLGSPAFPIQSARRSFFAVQKLPEWSKRIRDLEQEVRALKNKLNSNGSA